MTFRGSMLSYLRRLQRNSNVLMDMMKEVNIYGVIMWDFLLVT